MTTSGGTSTPARMSPGGQSWGMVGSEWLSSVWYIWKPVPMGERPTAVPAMPPASATAAGRAR